MNLIFLSDYVSIGKLTNRLIFVAIAKEKPGGANSTPPPPEIGLISTYFQLPPPWQVHLFSRLVKNQARLTR